MSVKNYGKTSGLVKGLRGVAAESDRSAKAAKHDREREVKNVYEAVDCYVGGRNGVDDFVNGIGGGTSEIQRRCDGQV